MHATKIVRGSLALAPAASPDRTEPWYVNALQQLLSDAMDKAGMPLGRRGSKAELSRRSGVDDGVISNIFNRPRYVPDESVRDALARTLSLSRSAIDTAAAGIKGLRVYPVGKVDEEEQRLEALRADLLLAAAEMGEEQRRKAEEALDEIAEMFRRRRDEGGSS